MKRIHLKIYFIVISGILFGAPCLRAQSDGALRTKEFVVMGYQGLLFELRSGEGPYLKTLMDLLRPEPDQRASLVRQVHSLSESYPNIMDFAEQVAKLQNESSTGSFPTEAQIALPKGPSIYSGDKLEGALDHLTKGMKVTVILKTGLQFSGQFVDFSVRRLFIQGASRKSFKMDEILAIDAPSL